MEDRKQDMGDVRQRHETGFRRQEMGDGRQEMIDRRWETEDRRQIRVLCRHI